MACAPTGQLYGSPCLYGNFFGLKTPAWTCCTAPRRPEELINTRTLYISGMNDQADEGGAPRYASAPKGETAGETARVSFTAPELKDFLTYFFALEKAASETDTMGLASNVAPYTEGVRDAVNRLLDASGKLGIDPAEMEPKDEDEEPTEPEEAEDGGVSAEVHDQ